MPEEYLKRSLLYIGNYLSVNGHDVDTTKITVFDKVDVSTSDAAHVDTFNFYFQVQGENKYYYATVTDANYHGGGIVFVGELEEHVKGVNDVR